VGRDFIVNGIYSYIPICLPALSVPLVKVSGPNGLSRFRAVDMSEAYSSELQEQS
jgi:hypothetical protein